MVGWMDGWMDRWILINTLFVANDRNPTQSNLRKKGRKNKDLVMFLNSPGVDLQEQLDQGT